MKALDQTKYVSKLIFWSRDYFFLIFAWAIMLFNLLPRPVREWWDCDFAKIKTSLDQWFRVIPDEHLIQEFTACHRLQINSVLYLLAYVIIEDARIPDSQLLPDLKACTDDCLIIYLLYENHWRRGVWVGCELSHRGNYACNWHSYLKRITFLAVVTARLAYLT